MELNPNHPVTQVVHDHWHKFCLIVMAKMGIDHIVITMQDLEDLTKMFPGDMPAIAICEREDGIHLDLLPRTEGMALAREQGGLLQ